MNIKTIPELENGQFSSTASDRIPESRLTSQVYCKEKTEQQEPIVAPELFIWHNITWNGDIPDGSGITLK
jgi:hypothetical protein